MSNWKCSVCGKEFEHFSIKDFSICPKTSLFGNSRIKDADDNRTVDRKTNKPVCSEECKQKNEERDAEITQNAEPNISKRQGGGNTGQWKQ